MWTSQFWIYFTICGIAKFKPVASNTWPKILNIFEHGGTHMKRDGYAWQSQKNQSQWYIYIIKAQPASCNSCRAKDCLRFSWLRSVHQPFRSLSGYRSPTPLAVRVGFICVTPYASLGRQMPAWMHVAYIGSLSYLGSVSLHLLMLPLDAFVALIAAFCLLPMVNCVPLYLSSDFSLAGFHQSLWRHLT